MAYFYYAKLSNRRWNQLIDILKYCRGSQAMSSLLVAVNPRKSRGSQDIMISSGKFDNCAQPHHVDFYSVVEED